MSGCPLQCQRCCEFQPIDRFHPRTGQICRRCRSEKERARYHAGRRAQAMLDGSSEEDFGAPGTSQVAGSAEAPYDESSGEEPEGDDHAPLGALYVMENPRIPSELKVGRSRNPYKRARSMSRAHNFEMRVVAVFPEAGHLETHVHHLLAADRVPGHSREFFRVSRKRAFSAISLAMTE